jgi:hypothetical protein
MDKSDAYRIGPSLTTARAELTASIQAVTTSLGRKPG